MHSTKTLVISLIIVAIIAVVADRLLIKNNSSSGTTPTPSVYAISPAPILSQATIRFNGSSVVPNYVNITAGGSVVFVNDSNTAFWPASDPHPSHTDCPGFDALRGLNRGEQYTMTFNRTETCPFHNHLDPFASSERGTISVQ